MASNPHETWELNIIIPILQTEKKGRSEVSNLPKAVQPLNSRADPPQICDDLKLTCALLGECAPGMV